MTFQEFVINLLSSATFSVVLVTALAFLARNWVSARLKSSIQHEYDQKLETHKAKLQAENEVFVAQLRANLEKEASVFVAGRSSFSEGQRVAMERRLDAIGKIWQAVLQIRKNTPVVVSFLDVIKAEEYPSILESKDYKTMAENFGPKTITSFAFSDDLELVRPYVGEYIWSLFYSYYAISIRILVLLYMSQTSPDKLEWYKDSGTRQLLETTLSDSEICEFDNLEFGKINWLKRMMEGKIIQSFQKLITGETFSEEAIQHASKIVAISTTLSQQR